KRAVAIDALRQEIEANGRRPIGVGGADVDAALALRPQLMSDDGHARLLGELEIGRHQEWLDGEHGVGTVETLAGFEEATQRRGGKGKKPPVGADVEEALP